MMRPITLAQYIQKNRSEFTKRRLRMEKRRAPVRKKKTVDEKAVLLRLDKERWDRWMRNGRIEIVEQRRFRMRLLLF